MTSIAKSRAFWGAALGVVAVVVSAAANPVATWHRFLADFWLPDTSRVGPNLLANAVQWVVFAILAVFVYPPLRKFVRGEFTHAHAKLDALLALSQHIIKHDPTIPTEHGVTIPPAGPLAQGSAHSADQTATLPSPQSPGQSPAAPSSPSAPQP